MFRLVLIAALFAAAPLPAGEINKKPSLPLDLDGRWQVVSSEKSLAGPIYFIFAGDMLTIESTGRDDKWKAKGSSKKSSTRWKLEIVDGASPLRIIRRRLDEDGKLALQTVVEAVDFRDGKLLLREASETEPAPMILRYPSPKQTWDWTLERVDTKR